MLPVSVDVVAVVVSLVVSPASAGAGSLLHAIVPSSATDATNSATGSRTDDVSCCSVPQNGQVRSASRRWRWQLEQGYIGRAYGTGARHVHREGVRSSQSSRRAVLRGHARDRALAADELGPRLEL